MTFNPPPVWTDERVAILKLRIAEGYSSGQIATEFDVTRNSIIGKATRLGLKFGLSEPSKPVIATVKRIPHHRKIPRLTVDRTKALRAEFERAATEATDLQAEPITAGEHITGAAAAVFALTSQSCRWPSDDDQPSPDFHFCMRTKLDGFPYCPGHCRLAYQLPVDRQRRAA